jgi:hypothetical protein
MAWPGLVEKIAYIAQMARRPATMRPLLLCSAEFAVRRTFAVLDGTTPVSSDGFSGLSLATAMLA